MGSARLASSSATGPHWWIANNQRTIAVNFHQDFTASMQINVCPEWMDKGLICWPNHSRETWLSNQEEHLEQLFSHKLSFNTEGTSENGYKFNTTVLYH
jgi:hypothetical protein